MLISINYFMLGNIVGGSVSNYFKNANYINFNYINARLAVSPFRKFQNTK